MHPAKWFFRKHEDEPTTEVAIWRSFAEDLYIVMPAFEVQEQTASVEVHINPLVNWIWVGFGVLAVGTLIALLPESAFAFAVAKAPAEVVTATLLLLSLLLTPGVAAAQHSEGPQTGTLVIRSPQERSVARKLACWCGGCSKLPVDTCVCSHCAHVREEIAEQVKAGKAESDILQYFVAQNGGQHVLSEPMTGFWRFAWVIPYGIGATGLLIVGLTASKWSKRREQRDADADPARDGLASDPFNEKLDDELRDLD